MSRTKKARDAIIPRDEDFLRWRKICEKNVITNDFDKYGRKLYGRSQESKRVYMASANQTLHIRSFIKLRPLLEEQRIINGGNGELPLLEHCKDGRTLRFARDPDINEDDELEAQEAKEHDDIPGATKFMHAFNCARLFDHTANQEQTFRAFMPSILDVIMYGGCSCLVVYGERGSGKKYSLFGRAVDEDYLLPERPIPEEKTDEEQFYSEINVHNLGNVGTGSGSDIDDLLSNIGSIGSTGSTAESDSLQKEQKDLRWLEREDEGEDTGILQRSISYLFDKIHQGRTERQSRYKIEMQCVASIEGSEVVHDMLQQDSNGKPVECFVQWEPSVEKFEAVGAEFVPYRSRKDMIYSALRCNFLTDYLGMSKCSLIYKFRVEITGIGDSSWKDIVGDQLDEGIPKIGEFTLIKVAGFEIEEGYPDDHGKDGIFKHNETLRFIVQTLEKQNYNNLPALRKKTVVPYRNNPVTRLMAPCLKQGSIAVFLGQIGIDKDAHVGTLHTLWAASKINKPISHRVSFKRALNKLKIVNLMSKVGVDWQKRSPEQREQRKIELKKHVFEATQANMHHILSDQHMLKSGNLEWSPDHQTQLKRAMPRLDRRVTNNTTLVSLAQVHKPKTKKDLMNVIDEEDDFELLGEDSKFHFKRTRKPLKQSGMDVKNGLFTNQLPILKMDRVESMI